MSEERKEQTITEAYFIRMARTLYRVAYEEGFAKGKDAAKMDYGQSITFHQIIGNQWIDVNDKLPGRDGFYLIWQPIHGTNIAHYFNSRKWATVINEEVTHWMPLPEPPEESEGNNDLG